MKKRANENYVRFQFHSFQEIDTLDIKDISNRVLNLQPDLEEFTKTQMEVLRGYSQLMPIYASEQNVR